MKTKGEKNTKYTDTFLFIYTWRRRGKQIIYKEEAGEGTKVPLHVRVSQFMQQDAVRAGVCFWSPLFVYWHCAMLYKTAHWARESREEREWSWEKWLDYLPRETKFCTSMQQFQWSNRFRPQISRLLDYCSGDMMCSVVLFRWTGSLLHCGSAWYISEM